MHVKYLAYFLILTANVDISVNVTCHSYFYADRYLTIKWAILWWNLSASLTGFTQWPDEFFLFPGTIKRIHKMGNWVCHHHIPSLWNLSPHQKSFQSLHITTFKTSQPKVACFLYSNFIIIQVMPFITHCFLW